MSTVVPKSWPSAHPALLDRDYFRLSVDDYHEMIAGGILSTEDRVELLDGILVKKMPQNSPHANTVVLLGQLFNRLAPTGYVVRPQVPLTLATSEPEPDIAFARGDLKSYYARNPFGSEIALIIEVSDSTVRSDREYKGVLYAKAGIAEYWIVNLVDSIVEVYTGPRADNGYANRRNFSPSETVPLVLDGTPIASFAVADLLP